MGAERRVQPRWELDAIEVVHITALDHYQLIASRGRLVDASASGFLIVLDRQDLLPRNLRSNLTLEPLIGQKVSLEIEMMNLDIIGEVTRTKPLGKGLFELGVDYSEDAPEYWRDCLLELLPKSREKLLKL